MHPSQFGLDVALIILQLIIPVPTSTSHLHCPRRLPVPPPHIASPVAFPLSLSPIAFPPSSSPSPSPIAYPCRRWGGQIIVCSGRGRKHIGITYVKGVTSLHSLKAIATASATSASVITDTDIFGKFFILL